MKYCAFCGSPMEDRKKRCPSCGEKCLKVKGKHRFRRILAAVLVCLILAGVAGVLLWQRPVKLGSAREAARYLEELGKEVGLRNATKDMEVLSEVTMDGDSFYRLGQTYKDIPVYGRTAVCMTGEAGELLGIAQNLRDMPLGLDLEPTITAREAAEAIAAYDGIDVPELQLTEEMLCIYDIDGDENVFLTYRIDVGAMEYLVDAQNARVLHSTSTVDLLREPIGFGTRSQFYGYQDVVTSTHYLMDYDHSIYLLDPQGGTYFYVDQQSSYFISGVLTLVTSPDCVFGNGNDNVPNALRAEPLLDMVRKIQDHFEEKTSIPFDATLMLIYDDAFLNFNGENAAGGWGPFPAYSTGVTLPGYDSSANGGKVGMITVGTAIMSDLRDNTDVIAHEYTHILSRRNVDWTGTNQENGALNEAFSDIFGVLTEAAIKSTLPDWKLLSRPVDIPSSRGYPTMANEYGTALTRFPVTLDDGSASTEDFSHFYSTVISHAAYRMWQGIPGDPGSALSEDELMRLWYRAMLLLPPDADFTDCRQVVLLAADSMDLDRSQLQSIRQAFDDANIPDPQEDFELTVSEGFELSVRDAEGDRVQSYSVVAEKLNSGLFGLEKGWRKSFSVRDGKDLKMDLEKGTYELIIINSADITQDMTVNIKVAKKGDDELRLYTDFTAEELLPEEETQPTEVPAPSETVPSPEMPAAPPAEEPAPPEEDHEETRPAQTDPPKEAGDWEIVRWDRSLRDEDGRVLVAYYCDYIRLNGDTKGIRAINQDQYDRAEMNMSTYTYEFIQHLADIGDDHAQTITTDVILMTEDLLFVREWAVGDGIENFGWAYDLSSGKMLSLGDVVSGNEKDLLEQVRGEVWAYVSSRYPDLLRDAAYDIIYTMDLEDFSYTVKDGQIYILFSDKVLVLGDVGKLDIPVDLYFSP